MAERRRRLPKPPTNDPLAWVDAEKNSAETDLKTLSNNFENEEKKNV